MKCQTENCPYDKLEKAIDAAAIIAFIHGGNVFKNLKNEIGDFEWKYCPYCGKELS